MESTVLGPEHDPTVYPEEEKVGEELLQRWIMELLRPLLERYLNGPGGRAPTLVGADQFIYFEQHDPHSRCSPDIYVLPGVEPETRVRSWKTWLHGPAPQFALEIVSTDWLKDYAHIPSVYDAAGVEELMIFDPSSRDRPRGEGAFFQVYRRDSGGKLVRIERHDRDRARSETLNLWFRTVGFGDRTRLRIATGPDGDELVPTLEEEREAERAEKEAERAEKEAALARVRELEARLREFEEKK